jgi:hypothetical protein
MKRSLSKAGWAVALLSGVAGLSVAAPAHADVTDQLLDRLKERGILSKAEYRSFKAKHAAEVRDAADRPHATTRRIVTKEGIKIVPVEDDIVRVLKVKDKGVGARIGDVDVTLSGNVNAFAVQNFGGSNRTGQPILGGLALGSRFLSGPNEASASYASRNGLLPAAFVLNLATRQEGYDIGLTFGVYPGINLGGTTGIGANQGGDPEALRSSGVDFRQIFATVGNDQIGTFKGGRDIGLFGSDAILNDFTIFGVGSPGAAGGNAAPANTSLGRIGLGYVYADFLPQLTYTTPDYHGLTASISAVSPLDESNFSTLSGQLSQHNQPQFQGKLKYVGDLAPGTKLTAWTDGLTQESKAGTTGEALPGGQSLRANALDGGAKLEVGPATLLAYGYYGDGLGTTGLFLDGVDPTGHKRTSYGGYGQVTYDLTRKLTLAGSYGVSYLNATAFDAATVAQGALVRKNESYLGAARYKLTTWVNLQAEFVHTVSTSQNGNQSSGNTVAGGAILFF